ncbi:MAG TPA: VWA domain-containing protein [Terriglobales bacterium]|nr:VWA domain-containing protein [Terriglobales bacterium]
MFFTLVLIVLSPSPGASAQKAEQGTQPTIRTETTLVEVPVIVSDKQGHPIADLRKEDFLVKEDGKRQEIAVFEHLKHVAAPAIALPVLEGVFTNRVQQTGPARLTIIAIDAVSTAITEQQDIRKQLVNFISRNVSVDQPVALVMLAENRIKVLHDFTTDPRVLVAALKNISSGHSAAASLASDDAVVQSIPNPLNSGMQNMFNQMVAAETDTIQTAFQSFMVGQRRTMVQNSLEAFNEIARAFVGIPGRKSLIWITNGASISTGDLDIAANFDRGQTVLGSTGLPNPIVPRTHDSPVSIADAGPRTEEYFQKTWKLLNSSDIAVYPLDISEASDPGFTNPALRVRSGLRRPVNNLDKLEEFAQSTGGSLCLRTSDLDDCFRKASEDSQDYYMLGYYPAPADKKTDWRRIQVSCVRKDVVIRARSGYFPQRTAHHESKDAAAPVLQAIGSPLEYTSLPLEVKLESPGPTPGDSSKRRVGFTFFVPPTADFISSADESMSLTFAALAKLPNATPAAQFLREASGKLKPEAAADLTIHGFALPGFVDLAPGEYALRCVVRNNLNGHIGSVTVPLKVPNETGARRK